MLERSRPVAVAALPMAVQQPLLDPASLLEYWITSICPRSCCVIWVVNSCRKHARRVSLLFSSEVSATLDLFTESVHKPVHQRC